MGWGVAKARRELGACGGDSGHWRLEVGGNTSVCDIWALEAGGLRLDGAVCDGCWVLIVYHGFADVRDRAGRTAQLKLRGYISRLGLAFDARW
jgi:hypothetical protein